MRKLWPLLILLLPGCTFFKFEKNVGPRSAAEMQEVSPGLYIILAVFCLILLMAVGTVLFKEESKDPRGDQTKACAAVLAIFAGLVVLLLVG